MPGNLEICLVSAPAVTDYRDPDQLASSTVQRYSAEAPLGVLTLAAELEQLGFTPAVRNLNRMYVAFCLNGGTPNDFVQHAGDCLSLLNCRAFGFSSMCNSYPLSLRIASEVKRRRPDSKVIFGGPQASVTDVGTLQTFPFVDFILRGEADRTLPVFLEECEGSNRYHRVPGLTFRSGAVINRNPDANVIADMDALPLPAFHLEDSLLASRTAALEAGRGCPFACRFCSTNDFFRRRFRLKSPGKILEHMRAIEEQFGHTQFDLTHDLFTVDRKRVVEFCLFMIAQGAGLTWNCSARTDCLDLELLHLMKEAGCVGLFYGVETGSPRMQKLIDKHLNIDHTIKMIKSARDLSISTTVSLIMGYPEETIDDLSMSLDMFMLANSCPKSDPQINLLAPLSGTPIHKQYADSLVFHDVCSDASSQGTLTDPIERLLVLAHPDLFPNFYLCPSGLLNPLTLLELQAFLMTTPAHCRWLIAALHKADPKGILGVFLVWLEQRAQFKPDLQPLQLRSYYTGIQFRWQFAKFVRKMLHKWPDDCVEALSDYECILEALWSKRNESPRSQSYKPQDLFFGGGLVRNTDVHVIKMNWSLREVLEQLKTEKHGQVRVPSYYHSGFDSVGLPTLTQIPEAYARVLQWSNGQYGVDEILQRFANLYPTWKGYDGLAASKSIIRMFLNRGVLNIRASDSLDLENQGTDASVPSCEFSSAVASQ